LKLPGAVSAQEALFLLPWQSARAIFWLAQAHMVRNTMKKADAHSVVGFFYWFYWRVPPILR
jgi:hypothetical protein